MLAKLKALFAALALVCAELPTIDTTTYGPLTWLAARPPRSDA